jgi:hypothetical protein
MVTQMSDDTKVVSLHGGPVPTPLAVPADSDERSAAWHGVTEAALRNGAHQGILIYVSENNPHEVHYVALGCGKPMMRGMMEEVLDELALPAFPYES